MIKSLLDADENPPPETRVIIEETTIEPPTAENIRTNTMFSPEQAAEIEDILGIAPPANAAQNHAQTPTTAPEVSVPPVENANFQMFGETPKTENVNFILPANDGKTAQPNLEQALFQTEYQPETTAETMRKSGLAYAAAITLFGAVVFMMILGWGADLLFGSSPWGIVGGIVLGAVIGFVQLFRLTSQIIKNKE